MNVDIKRLMKNLRAVGEIGRSETGITRTPFSKAYYEATEVLKDLMIQAGLEVHMDPIGNVYGKRKGKDNKLPSIMIGSHLDSNVNGGLYDGLLGIISGLEIVNMLNDENIKTDHPIEVAAFNFEEGTDELGGTFGSRVVTGRQNFEEEGLVEKISRYDVTVEDCKNSIRNMDDIHSYLELHIEQGPFLDHGNIDIGVVDGIVGIKRYYITIQGESNHGGTTPMDGRKDPVVVAAKVVNKINELAKAYEHPFVTTVGNIVVEPGIFNVIADTATIYVETRDLNEDNIDEFYHNLKNYCETFTENDINWTLNIIKPAKFMTKEITKIINDVSAKKGYSKIHITSGAGHDAKEFIYKVPSAMVFVPNKDGISHSPLEYASEEGIAKGVSVLYDTLFEVDKLEFDK